MFSGGAASWAAAKRVAERHGTDDLVLLFADTRTEDVDLYRFIKEAAANVGGEFITLDQGENIWDVFKRKRYLGNSRRDPCSQVLKREPTRKWVLKNCRPADTVLYLGYDWTEQHRADRTKLAWPGWKVEAPMCERPWVTKPQMLIQLQAFGIEPPRLYGLGMPHNNCGGGCVKAGIGHFAHLLEVLPDVYADWEMNEQKIREHLGKNVTILKDRRNKTQKPLSLRELRERIVANNTSKLDMEDIGGCGCFSDPPVKEAVR